MQKKQEASGKINIRNDVAADELPDSSRSFVIDTQSQLRILLLLLRLPAVATCSYSLFAS